MPLTPQLQVPLPRTSFSDLSQPSWMIARCSKKGLPWARREGCIYRTEEPSYEKEAWLSVSDQWKGRKPFSFFVYKDIGDFIRTYVLTFPIIRKDILSRKYIIFVTTGNGRKICSTWGSVCTSRINKRPGKALSLTTSNYFFHTKRTTVKLAFNFK